MLSIDVDGGEQIAGRLGRVDLDPPALAAGIAAAAVRARAPIRTGALLASITAHTTAAGIAVHTGIPYARPVEARHPYVNPGLRQAEPGMLAAWEHHITAQLHRI